MLMWLSFCGICFLMIDKSSDASWIENSLVIDVGLLSIAGHMIFWRWKPPVKVDGMAIDHYAWARRTLRFFLAIFAMLLIRQFVWMAASYGLLEEDAKFRQDVTREFKICVVVSSIAENAFVSRLNVSL
eukprot:SAG31_NODE_9179_length_1320_cov_1.782146_2_plen_129_part_00